MNHVRFYPSPSLILNIQRAEPLFVATFKKTLYMLYSAFDRCHKLDLTPVTLHGVGFLSLRVH